MSKERSAEEVRARVERSITDLEKQKKLFIENKAGHTKEDQEFWLRSINESIRSARAMLREGDKKDAAKRRIK